MSDAQQENDELRARIGALEEMVARMAAASAVTPPAAGGSETARGTAVGSPRQLLKLAGATALGAAGAAAVSRAQPAGAADGDAITAGNTTTAEVATTLKYDGTSSPGVVLLANDTGFSPGDANYPASLGGWAENTVANGVYGYTNNGGGSGVVGDNASSGSGSGSGVLGVASNASMVGVKGTNTKGTGVYGSSDSTADNAMAITGVLTSTTPGSFSSAVRAQNNGTGGLGIGLYASQAGGGWRVYVTSASGIGVNAESLSGTGVKASGGSGRGVVASGETAQLLLAPNPAPTHPVSGWRGTCTWTAPSRCGCAWAVRAGAAWGVRARPASCTCWRPRRGCMTPGPRAPTRRPPVTVRWRPVQNGR